MGKGEIARYEQFLLFPQCFKKRLVSQGCQKVSLRGNGLTPGQNLKIHEKIVTNGESCCFQVLHLHICHTVFNQNLNAKKVGCRFFGEAHICPHNPKINFIDQSLLWEFFSGQLKHPF